MPTLLYIDDQTWGSRTLVQELRGAGYELQIAPAPETAARLCLGGAFFLLAPATSDAQQG